jgi:protocatechuate 3,4-dioxygenase beta subunit
MRIGTIKRRRALELIGASGAAAAVGYGASSPTAPDGASGGASNDSSNAACAETPSETAGPFPSLTEMFRSDIREGKAGAMLTLTIQVVNGGDGCSPVQGANVEIWHVDAAGDYSQYGSQSAQTFLRGIQTTDASGQVVFTTIYPGWYQGRATHIHVEVGIGGVSRKVTQIAFPEDVSDLVHASGAYSGRGANPTANSRDGIFADSLVAELVEPTGDPTSGYAATFQVTLSV